MSTSEERLNSITDVFCDTQRLSIDGEVINLKSCLREVIAASDATRPKLSDEQISRIKLDVFHIIRDYQKDTPGHTSPLAARIVKHVLEAALKDMES